MITFIAKGNIFFSECDALVNPVNCMGTMGKGLALAFKQNYPEIMAPYVTACADKSLCMGNIQVLKAKNGKTIINFPTKNHWRNPSRIHDIISGLGRMATYLFAERGKDIRSVAIPALGCGLGGLRWGDCRYYIEDCYETVSLIREIDFDVYEPQ